MGTKRARAAIECAMPPARAPGVGERVLAPEQQVWPGEQQQHQAATQGGGGGVGGEGGRAQNNAARKPARPSPFNHLRTSTISGIGTPLPWASLAHRLMAVEASVEDA